MKEKQTQINFRNDRCIITDTSVLCGFSFNLKDVETCDLKFLLYKLHKELLNRGDV